MAPVQRTTRLGIPAAVASVALASVLAFAAMAFAPASAFANPISDDFTMALAKGAPVDEVLATIDIEYTTPEATSPGTEGAEPPSGDTQETQPAPVAHTYSFSVTDGSLPAGLSLSQRESGATISLVLSGTPTETGEYFCAVTWKDTTANATVGTFGLTIGVFVGPAVTVTATTLTLFDDEQAKFDATASGGTGDYLYRWFKMDADGNTVQVGDNINYLFYPGAGTLSLEDDGLTFYCEVIDNISGLSGVSAYSRIEVSCRHSFGSWSEKSPATCTEAQVLSRVCSKCGVEETKDGTPAKGHTWGTWLQSSSDTMVHTCEVCGEQEIQELAAGTPFIRRQPQGGSIYEGETLTLSVAAEATGLGSLSYEWLRSDTADGEAVTAPGAATSAEYVATEEGYYRVRITQRAGADENSVESKVVRVHVHEMSVWIVDTGQGTATRVCLTSDCPSFVSETINLDEMIELYPEDAEALGLSKFRIFAAQHKLLMLVAGILAALVAVAIIVLIAMNKRQREAIRSSKAWADTMRGGTPHARANSPYSPSETKPSNASGRRR